MTKALKPCPFCGGRAHKRTIKIHEHYGRKGNILKRRMIECRTGKCHIRPSTWLYINTLQWDEVIAVWNQRPVKQTDQEN